MPKSKTSSSRHLTLLFGVAFTLVVITSLLYIYIQFHRYVEDTSAVQVVTADASTPTPSSSSQVTPQPSTARPLPATALINVPFQVQAPHANWDAFHEETCEEASLLMVQHFISGTPIDSADSFDAELHDLVTYETNHDYSTDVTLEELNAIAKGRFNLETGIISDTPTVDAIKAEVAAGHPVIVPAAGQLLANPNFKQPGPIYHMLVIKGYDETGFITNDPGISQGNGFHYTYDNLIGAIHNWNSSDILQGEKQYLVFR